MHVISSLVMIMNGKLWKTVFCHYIAFKLQIFSTFGSGTAGFYDLLDSSWLISGCFDSKRLTPDFHREALQRAGVFICDAHNERHLSLTVKCISFSWRGGFFEVLHSRMFHVQYCNPDSKKHWNAVVLLTLHEQTSNSEWLYIWKKNNSNSLFEHQISCFCEKDTKTNLILFFNYI